MTGFPRVARAGNPRPAFALALTVVATLYVVYGVNLARWRNSPDFGWRTMYDSGPNVVAEVFEVGRAAGLRAGDRIQAINGRSYRTFEELFFHDVRWREPGSVNRYRVERTGGPVDVTVPTGRLGVKAVLWRSGPLFGLGLVYVLIGVLVFLMKPRAPESRIFFLMTSLIGLRVSYAAPSDLIRPTWMYDVRYLIEVSLPAAMLHLAITFPKTRSFLRARPRLAILPYAVSLTLFSLLKVTSTAYWNIPRPLFLATQVYTLVAIVVFLGSMAWNVLRDTSMIVRLQSQVIFGGIVLGFLIPTADLISRFLWQVYLIPDPALAFVLFLSLFPMSIGYTIVKHDLFAIDVIVRRTYGYVLSTATIVAAYGLIVSTLNVTFQSTEVSRSPLFSIAFALGIVFLFEPIHRRVRRLVDRIFYRQHYDYRKTIKALSEAMTSILDRDVILQTLVGAAVREMFLERGVILLADPAATAYRVTIVEGALVDGLVGLALPDEEPLVKALRARADALARHEVELNPAYEATRQDLQRTMQALGSDLVLPVIYKDRMRAILSLGAKKSGKMFTPEDLDLLHTLANQSAIALENATIHQQVVRYAEELETSLRRIQILESMKRNLVKFVPRTVQELIEESPEAPSLEKRETDVSVLFADITGYTSLSAQMGLDEVNQLVEQYFSAFLDEILSWGGDVNETAGDGLMVTFRERDRDPERHARAAVLAALGIQRRTRELNAELQGRFEPITMKVGVNSGIAWLGATKIEGAAGTRWTYTASGTTTNVAARLATLPEGDGAVLISAETRGRLGNEFEIEDLGLHFLKNLPESMPVHRVLCRRSP